MHRRFDAKVEHNRSYPPSYCTCVASLGTFQSLGGNRSTLRALCISGEISQTICKHFHKRSTYQFQSVPAIRTVRRRFNRFLITLSARTGSQDRYTLRLDRSDRTRPFRIYIVYLRIYSRLRFVSFSYYFSPAARTRSYFTVHPRDNAFQRQR